MRTLLNHRQIPYNLQSILSVFRRDVVCDDSIVNGIEQVMVRWMAGHNDPHRPVGSFLWFGPSGVGKTYAVQTLTTIMHGSPRYLITVDCGEFTHSHEVARITGAPPGYLGHKETKPIFTNDNIRVSTTSNFPVAIILFDEIEKAHPDLYATLLGVLDRAVLTTGGNDTVSFSNTLIFFTSNLAHDAILRRKPGVGYHSTQSLSSAVRDAAIQHFGSPFVNRIDVIDVWQPLRPHDIERIVHLEVQKATLSIPYNVRLTQSAVEWLASYNYDPRMGARHIRRNVQEFVVTPLCRIKLNQQAPPNSVIDVDVSSDQAHLDMWLNKHASASSA